MDREGQGFEPPNLHHSITGHPCLATINRPQVSALPGTPVALKQIEDQHDRPIRHRSHRQRHRFPIGSHRGDSPPVAHQSEWVHRGALRA